MTSVEWFVAFSHGHLKSGFLTFGGRKFYVSIQYESEAHGKNPL
jgi:hypothetical protein